MKTLKVYDPAMCCSTGVCGPAVQPELVQFANDLALLKERGVSIERFNLGQQPAAFAQNAEVRSLLNGEGLRGPPIVMVDDTIATKGVYPTYNQLAKLVGLGETPSCGCQSGCASESGKAVSNQADAQRVVQIDFMYIDLDVCTRCEGTDANLDTALTTVQTVLQAAGIQTEVKKTLIDSEEKAMELGFVSSPTIRVNGRDIALQLQESNCSSCGEASGTPGEVDCRVWVYRGQEYTEAPVPMIVDAILSQCTEHKKQCHLRPQSETKRYRRTSSGSSQLKPRNSSQSAAAQRSRPPAAHLRQQIADATTNPANQKNRTVALVTILQRAAAHE